jgi:hypothetical protein
MRVDEFPILIGELAIFNVNNPKNRRGDATFSFLQGTTFTAAQKNFLAAQCTGNIGDLPDIRFGDTGNQLKTRYGLPFGTVNRWISHFKSPTAENIIDPMVVPNILKPLNLRRLCKYRSLRRYTFTPAEKKWICKNLVHFCDDLDKELVNHIRLFSNRYDVRARSVGQWMDTYANGDEFL